MGIILKPKLKDIDLNTLKREQIEYFCTTQIIDKKRCELAGIPFDQDLADFMEEKVKYYFLVKINLEYDIIPGTKFDHIMKDLELYQKQHQSKKARRCIDHYIKNLK